MSFTLRDLGWNQLLNDEWLSLKHSDWYPARISRETRINYTLLSEQAGEHCAVLAGKLWHAATSDAQLPTVGDWVVVDPGDGSELPVIRALLPRKNRFSRKVPGKSCAEQVIAANVDAVIVMTDALADWNLNRLERYLTLIRRCSAQSIVLFNKMDLTDPEKLRRARDEVAHLSPETSIHAISATQHSGYPDLLTRPPQGFTFLIVGSSGVGKSTLVNSLVGFESRRTACVNQVTGKGRHTTVARELLPLPSGGVLIDNPGMREVQMWTHAATLRAQFDDISTLAQHCRYADCSHNRDAGCAVRAALERGDISREHYEHFLHLDDEIALLEKRAEKRRMTLERVSCRVKRSVLRNHSDREEHARTLAPHRQKWGQ